jgi:hypothetical protein
VIRVRQPVRPRARLRDDGALLESEDRLGRAREREQRLDRIPALRVRGGMARTLDDAQD